jgi:hypothetical protein
MLRLFDGSDDTSPELKDDVKALQTLLGKDGFSLAVDGLFGPDTEAAVKRFQLEQGLLDDGVVGPVTWAALAGVAPPDPTKTLPTTYPANDASLLSQLELANALAAVIRDAAARLGVPTSAVAGIGSRESRWGLALRPTGAGGTGDFTPRRYPTQFRNGPLPPDGGGFGRGLMQIDYDAQEFARTGPWKDPGENVRAGCAILAGYRDLVQRKTSLTGIALLRAALASYNCGPGNVLRALEDGRDVDFYTAGRDYSQDVTSRAGWFELHGWT